MVVDERHAGEEGVIRSDIADVIDRSAAMAAYAFAAIRKAGEKGGIPLPEPLAEHLAESTYMEVMRYSLDECSCPCHQEHH